jgi:hypothetical protein
MFANWAKRTLIKASYYFKEESYTRRQWVYFEGDT